MNRTGVFVLQDPGTSRETSRQWLKRAGAAGFAFFLIKGLAWLLVPFVVATLW